MNDPVNVPTATEVSTQKYNPGSNPDQPSHDWPADGEHLWGEWMLERAQEGTKPPTQYRTCVHPTCHAVDRREYYRG